MSNAPGNQDIRSFQIAVLSVVCPQHSGNGLDEADLRALMEEDGTLEPLPGEGAVPTVPEPEPEPTPEPEPEPEKPGNAGMLLLVLAVMGIGGGAAWYFKIYRPKHQQADQPEEDDGGEYPDYDEFEDDGPPWDEEDETEEKEEIR